MVDKVIINRISDTAHRVEIDDELPCHIDRVHTGAGGSEKGGFQYFGYLSNSMLFYIGNSFGDALKALVNLTSMRKVLLEKMGKKLEDN